MRNLKQSATANVMVFMTDAADHVSGKASLTLTITASKDGAAFAAITPTVTERGNGWYSLALTTSHTDTLGDLALHITGTGADPTDLLCRIVAGSLDADVSSRLASASYTAPPSAAAIRTEMDTNSTRLDVAVSTRLAGASYTAPDNAGIATISAAVDTEIGAIKARTDNLPADTAATLTTITSYVDEIESRLTAPRAAALDNLDAAVSTRLATAGYTAPDNAGIASIGAAVDTEVAAIKAKTDTLPASPAATGDIPSAASIAAAIATRVAEGSLTWEHILRVLLAHAAGNATGLTTAPAFKSQDGLTDRIVGTISGGTRTVTSVDGS